jgi:hypothetical protein
MLHIPSTCAHHIKDPTLLFQHTSLDPTQFTYADYFSLVNKAPPWNDDNAGALKLLAALTRERKVHVESFTEMAAGRDCPLLDLLFRGRTLTSPKDGDSRRAILRC